MAVNVITKLATVAALFLLSTAPLATDAFDGEVRLHHDLFSTYDKAVRPLHDPHHTLHIDIEFDLTHFKKLDEHTEVLHTVSLIDAEWHDDFLKWDPGKYDDVEQIVLQPTEIWLPDIGIQNSASHFYPESYYEIYRVHVHNTGLVRWWFGGVMDTSCHVDGTLFPFDSQVCSIVIESWAYSEAFVDLRNHSNYVHLDGFNDDDIWHLVATKVQKHDVSYSLEPNVKYARLEYTLYIDRKPLYYVINIMMPCSFLVVISLLTFWLPPDSEEKISLSITVLLAFSVFQFVVTDLTPSSSDSTPIIGVFVMVTIGLSTVSVVTSILIVRLSNMSRPLPLWFQHGTFRVIARAMCVQLGPRPSSAVGPCDGDLTQKSNSTTQLMSVEADISRDETATKGSSNELRDIGCKIDNVLNELHTFAQGIRPCDAAADSNGYRQRAKLDQGVDMTGLLVTQHAREEMAEGWRNLATVIDRLLFTFSFTVLLTIALWMIIKSTEHPDTTGAIPAVFDGH